MSASSEEPAVVKLVTAAHVRPAANEAFIAWGSRVDEALHAAPGYAGREIIAPQAGDPDQWVFVTRFDSLPNLRAWRDSEVRARLFDDARPLLVDGVISELAGSAADQFHVENSVTEVSLEQVLPSKAGAYRAWSSRIQQAQATMPGYQGGYTKPPPPGGNGWMTLMRFATVEDLNHRISSPERTALMKEAKWLVKQSFLHRVDTAFPGWAPTDPLTGRSPPDWKTTMPVLLGLYPIVSLEIGFLMEHLSGLRPAIAGFIGNAISVTLVAYITMPLLVRRMGWWLFPKPENAGRITIGGTVLIAAIYALEIAAFWKLL